MKLKFEKDYKSIKGTEEKADISLPDFTVLTGLNGSGKTHVLEAINVGDLVCDKIGTETISLMTYQDLLTQQVQAANVKQQCEDFLNKVVEQGEAFSDKASEKSTTWRNKILQIYNMHLAWQDHRDHHLLVEKTKIEKPVWSISKADVDSELWEKISAFKNEIGREVFGNDKFKEFPFYEHIQDTYIKHAIVTADRGFHYSQFVDIVSMQTLDDLTSEFIAYEKRREEYANQQFQQGRSGSKPEFIEEYDKKVPKPWNLFNQALKEAREILGSSSGFNFQVTYPGFSNWRSHNAVRIFNRVTNTPLEFGELSSGEKVIFSLLMLMMKAEEGFLPPKLLLLDEIDATLHPSMIKAMIEVIRRVFLDKGAKVILATHSPTTLSLVEEEAIYLVNTNGKEEVIEKASKATSLKALTEGYATLQDLVEFAETDKEYVLISEGRNCNYLKKACEYFDPEKKIEVLDLKDFGTGQLREIFKFMQHVNNTKKFVFVWDCDYRKKEIRDQNNKVVRDENGVPQLEDRDLGELEGHRDRDTRAFIFEHNQSSQSKRGIENLFDAVDTENFNMSFDEKGPKNKKGFEQRVLGEANEGSFKNFKPLFDFVLDVEV